MKAVIAEMPAHWLAERRASDVAQWDEVWDGVLHMAPMPSGIHQDLELDLAAYLKRVWARPNGGLARHQVNLTTPEDEAAWTKNYRIPDIVLVARDRLHIDRGEYMAGAPNVVVEIRSPGDETDEKLPFYFGLGVPEVWVFDRDTKAVELRVLTDAGYALLAPDADGWVRSPATGVGFRPAAGNRVRARVGDDDATGEDLPDVTASPGT